MDAYMMEPMKVKLPMLDPMIEHLRVKQPLVAPPLGLEGFVPPPGLEEFGPNGVTSAADLVQMAPLFWQMLLNLEKTKLSEGHANSQLAESEGFAVDASGKEDELLLDQREFALIDRVEASSRIRQMRTVQTGGGGMQIEWPVDAKKLRSSDLYIVSPRFEVAPGAPCKLMIKPAARGGRKGQGCFRKSKGRGCVQVKCFAETSSADSSAVAMPLLSFQLSVGSADVRKSTPGIVMHNFADASVCSLHSEMEEIDFGSAVDHDAMTFIVRLYVRRM